MTIIILLLSCGGFFALLKESTLIADFFNHNLRKGGRG